MITYNIQSWLRLLMAFPHPYVSYVSLSGSKKASWQGGSFQVSSSMIFLSSVTKVFDGFSN